MKYQYYTAAITAFAISATVAVAQEKNQQTTNTQTPDNQWLVDTSKLDGTEVYDFHGSKLGEIQQVLVDPKSGRIRYGVMEVDKAWNWNDPMVAIPWGSFTVKKANDKTPTLSLDSTKEKLEKAPKYKVGDAGSLYRKEAGEPIYTYWGIYWFDDPSDSSQSGNKNQQPGASGSRESGSSASSNTGSGQKNQGQNQGTGTDSSNKPQNDPTKANQDR